MTAVRLHLAPLSAPAALSFDQQAAALLAAVTPAMPVWQVVSMEHAWDLAQFVDLVEAGYGARNALWRSARQALLRFVQAHGQEPACRALCARAACLADMVATLEREQPEQQEQPA